MAFKGFNSILFDFYSLVDIKLSLIKFLADEYKDTALDNFDKHKLVYTKHNEWIFQRVYGPEDVFKSILREDLKGKSDEIFKQLLEKFEKEVYSEKYLVPTDISNLISAYRKAGNGIIKTSVRCDTELQKKYIASKYPECIIDFGKREDINMSKYARVIVGFYRDALEYRLEEPKSILVLNFRENFEDKDITLLKPELVINLGDVNDISVASAYVENQK